MSHPIAKDKTFKLMDGAEWADHEDCLIGNAKGIESLRDACDVALKEGVYYGSDLGDYVGVKVIEDSWFSDPEDSSSTNLGNLVGGAIFACVLLFMAVGMFTIGKAVFELFT